MRRHWKGRPPAGWLLARGIHRTVLFFLLTATLLGGVGGVALHAGLPHASAGWICLGCSLLAAIWPLAWMATLRIAWPLRELAAIAHDLRGGKLSSRELLPEGPSEVGQVGDALRGISDRLARQLAHQRALMAAVSHELRSPLGRARVMIELAREGNTAVYDELQREIDGMDHLVGDLLAAARIDFEAVSPRELEPRAVALQALQIAGLPAETLVCEGELRMLRADPTLLARALAVLLDNARRYGGATVRLHLRPRLHRLRFVVEDDGPGFPEGDPEQAFQPFWRGNAVAPGEGLGLALVRQIAEAHQGEAGAENRQEGGARVWMELPWGEA